MGQRAEFIASDVYTKHLLGRLHRELDFVLQLRYSDPQIRPGASLWLLK
jgi:hypothetical protein